MRGTLVSLLLLFISSCAHMKSGQHVYWQAGVPLEQLAQDNATTVQEIRDLNPQMKPNQWVFVPNKVGLLPYLRGTVVIEDYSSLGGGEYAWPVPKVRKVSSGFGNRWGKKHEGIDIPAPIGTPVVAVKDGIVKYSDDRISGYGNMIVLEHAGQVFSVYAHLDDSLVTAGTRVKRGQLIARSGNTGRSTGPHLHFEIRVKDQARDPAAYLKVNQ